MNEKCFSFQCPNRLTANDSARYRFHSLDGEGGRYGNIVLIFVKKKLISLKFFFSLKFEYSDATVNEVAAVGVFKFFSRVQLQALCLVCVLMSDLSGASIIRLLAFFGSAGRWKIANLHVNGRRCGTGKTFFFFSLIYYFYFIISSNFCFFFFIRRNFYSAQISRSFA